MTNNDKIKYINKCLYDLFKKINQNNISNEDVEYILECIDDNLCMCLCNMDDINNINNTKDIINKILVKYPNIILNSISRFPC
jgi:hypothetical protein